jgi:hypothetical protein
MKVQRVANSKETNDTLRALRRAARQALELGVKTGTPVYVVLHNKIVDLTQQQRRPKRSNKAGTSKTSLANKKVA